MSDKNQDQQRHQEEQRRQHEEEQRRKQQEEQQRQRDQGQHPGQPGQPSREARPGSRQANPAQPYAETVVPERPDASSFMRAGVGQLHPSGYPKLKFHPVHGGIEVKDPGEESNLFPPTDWFDSAELADAARTWTEAEQVRLHNQMMKLKELDEQGHPIVRNSVQSDEAVRRAQPEPL